MVQKKEVDVHALNANLQTRAAIGKHSAQMRLVAVVGPSFNSDADALLPALFAITYLCKILQKDNGGKTSRTASSTELDVWPDNVS
jgi:hypothetical protein